jgi:hypothetical protein
MEVNTSSAQEVLKFEIHGDFVVIASMCPCNFKEKAGSQTYQH